MIFLPARHTLTKFVLPATLLVIPPNIISTIQTMLYKFLWGKKDKVKRLKVIQETQNGGLNMVDVRSSFISYKALWVKRLLTSDPNVDSWSQIGHLYIKPFLDCDTQLLFNFDDSVDFPDLERLSQFYKDVLLCYNKVYVKEINEFRHNIGDQCIWANKFIVLPNKKRKSVLFLRNWIRSGVNKIADLKFIDGKLDVDFIFRKIRFTQNILAEICSVRDALVPHQNYLRNVANSLKGQVSLTQNSKAFYVLLRDNVTEEIPFIPDYLLQYCANHDVSNIFKIKITQQTEIKLKEFNFKLLRGILPCYLNLCRWKIRSNSNCDVCGQSQTQEHLLWDCCYVKPLWKIVEKVCGINLDYRFILGILLCNRRSMENLLTLVSFLIYKEWLILSFESKKRRQVIGLEFYKQELFIRLKIYEKCTNFAGYNFDYIRKLIDGLG